MRGFVFIVFVVLSLIFIDTNIKYIFFGVAGYSNVLQFLATVILTSILAIQIIIVVVLVAPNRKGIITFCSVLVTFLILWEFILGDQDFLGIIIINSEGSASIASLIFPILVGIVTASILTALEEALKKYKSEEKYSDTPFWNIQAKAKKIFDVKFNLILWALITTELILSLQGISLLLWLTILI